MHTTNANDPSGGEVSRHRERRPRAGAGALRTLLAAVAMTAGLEGQASAQYFGQNKVRPRAIDFQVLSTEHFNVYFPKDAHRAATDAGRMAERWYARLSHLLDHRLSSRQDLVLYAARADFRGTTVVPDAIGEATGGLTEGSARRIVMPVGTSLGETDHVLGHELVHAFQFDLAEDRASAAALPLWFVEGMAEYLSIGSDSSLTAMWLRDAAVRHALPTIAELDDPRYFPYRWGHAFWTFVGERAGDEAVGAIFRHAAQTGLPEEAIRLYLGVDTESLSVEWHAAIARRVERALAVRNDRENVRRIAETDAPGRSLQLSPVVSPDGKLVAYFSDDGLGSVDLFVADIATGRIHRRLTSLATDAHIDSLQFTNSSGAWRADAGQFVFGTVRGGQAELAFYDMGAERIVRTLPLPSVDEVLAVSWSPDVSSLVFSGMTRGSADLFHVDSERGAIRRLTDDVYADLQPAFAPDGRRVAFVTDRFTTDLATLAAGPLRLAVMDVSGGEPVPAFALDEGHQTSPHWSADSRALFFVGERAGTTDVYRLSLNDRMVHQVTRVTSGVSGLSHASPAFSLAGNRAVASVFRDGSYELHAVDLEDVTPESFAATGTRAPDAPDRDAGAVDALVRDAMRGLASADTFTLGPYRPRLRLDSFAPLSAGLGVGDFGAYVGGGSSFSFTDTLGQHRLTIGVQAATIGGDDGGNLSAFGAYLNQRGRWDWGFRGGQSMQPTRGYSTALATVGNQLAIQEEQVIGTRTDREIAAVFARPFSRARRIELTGGLQTISFAAESTVNTFSAATGALIGSSTTTLPAPGRDTFATATAALVHDTAILGGTGPVAGMRYRIEGGVFGGSARFATLLADVRRYTPLGGPFTLAARAMHVGRYAAGTDPRVGDLTIGYASLVRGYEVASYTPADCRGEVERCRPFERLFGSRIGVANVELRAALVGPRALLRTRTAPPIDLALFADAGLAWAPVGTPDSGNRTPLTSIGASLRFNLFGFGVGQLSYVRPNSRVDRNWRWEFSLTPGF